MNNQMSRFMKVLLHKQLNEPTTNQMNDCGSKALDFLSCNFRIDFLKVLLHKQMNKQQMNE